MIVPALWSWVQKRVMLLALHDIGWHFDGLEQLWFDCLEMEMKAVAMNHATPGSRLPFPTGAGLRSLGSFQAVRARCQVPRRLCFWYALCSKVIGESRAEVYEDRKMLFAALIHTS